MEEEIFLGLDNHSINLHLTSLNPRRITLRPGLTLMCTQRNTNTTLCVSSYLKQMSVVSIHTIKHHTLLPLHLVFCGPIDMRRTKPEVIQFRDHRYYYTPYALDIFLAKVSKRPIDLRI
jgi:hypothetical protein